MQKHYQDAANQLQTAVEEALMTLRKKLVNEGLNIDNIPKQPMAVEIASFALVNCLIEERLAFNSLEDPQKARQEAMTIVKAAVIQYRGKNLVPPSKHQLH